VRRVLTGGRNGWHGTNVGTLTLDGAQLAPTSYQIDLVRFCKCVVRGCRFDSICLYYVCGDLKTNPSTTEKEGGGLNR